MVPAEGTGPSQALAELRAAYAAAKAAFHVERSPTSRERCREAKAALREALPAGSSLQCDRAVRASPGPWLLFDLNYQSQMSGPEAGALCRQLTLSYAANARAAAPFRLCMAGEGVDRPGSGPLAAVLHRSSWHRWAGVTRLDSSEPWAKLGADGVVYLCSDSEEELEQIDEKLTYVIGGLVDRKDKPGRSLARAAGCGLRTAKLPLDRFLELYSRQHGGKGSADLSTLAVVQILLLFRETGDWASAVTRCPALRSAPMRKYVRWRAPYGELNNTDRPPDPFIRGKSAEYESQELVASTERQLQWK